VASAGKQLRNRVPKQKCLQRCAGARARGGGVIYFDVKANVATSHLQKMLSFKIILYGATIMIIILFDLNLGKALEIRSDRKD